MKAPNNRAIQNPIETRKPDIDGNYRDYEHICPACGYKNNNHRTHCWNCNKEINTEVK